MAFPEKETGSHTLDQSEWLVLKEFASFFLSVDFPGSQLEALLRARASLPVSNIDEITPSILTPAVLTTPSASGSEVGADAQTIQPPLVPSPADRTPSPTRQPTPSPQSVLEPDNSFENSTTDGPASNVPVEVNSCSHCAEGIRVSKTSTLSHSKIRNSVVTTNSFNGNVDSTIIRIRGPM